MSVRSGNSLPGDMQEILSGIDVGQQVVQTCWRCEYGGSVMIRGIIDFALNNRWLVLGCAVILFAWGIVSFHNLPVEAYPDVASNYVQVIHAVAGRAAEEVEQQVTTPIEIQMAGIPHMTPICGRPRLPDSPASP